ncbi:DUF2767 family protein [Salmonella enterica subsp. enterica serovar Saintpaul]|nr:DUF2767 family protein [Salmonella enterica subsp. enterica serovar Saintpaul]
MELNAPDDEVYNEACRIIGQCCITLASEDIETTREQIVYQLKRLHWIMTSKEDGSNAMALLQAIEQLKGFPQTRL